MGRTLGSAESVNVVETKTTNTKRELPLKTQKHKPMRSDVVSTDKIPKIENKEFHSTKIYKVKIFFLQQDGDEFYWMDKVFSFQEFENKKLNQPARYDLNKIDQKNKFGVTIHDGNILDIKYVGDLNEKNVRIDETEIPGLGDPVSYLLVASFPK